MATAKKTSTKVIDEAPVVKTKSTKGKTAAPKSDKGPTAKRAPNAGLMKALKPSAELAAVIGDGPYPRTQVVSKLWDYIKANNLQDASSKRNVNADAKLKAVFGKNQVSMFELAGLIGKHLS